MTIHFCCSCTALDYTALHCKCTRLRYTARHSTALYFTADHCAASSPQNTTMLHWLGILFVALQQFSTCQQFTSLCVKTNSSGPSKLFALSTAQMHLFSTLFLGLHCFVRRLVGRSFQFCIVLHPEKQDIVQSAKPYYEEQNTICNIL